MPSDSDQDKIANLLLLSLSDQSMRRLKPHLEFRAFSRGQVSNREGRPVQEYHFVNRGLISLVKTMNDGRAVEIGIVGIEGLTTAHTLFSLNRVAIDTVVQIPGNSLVIRRDALLNAMSRDGGLRSALQNYANFAYGAVAQTAACNRLHYLEERCCRWLLIALDNARADTFPLTHEFLAMMLGVQRSGVSIAANFLQKAGLISYKRGLVTVRDRAGLEEGACECYRSMREHYHAVMRYSQRKSV